jgi:hypothetical protein
MPDQKTIDLIGQEVHTPNHVRKFEQEKKAKELEATAQSVRDNGLGLSKETQAKPEPTLAELKASHDNHFLNQQIEMMRKELVTMINEKKQNYEV